MNALENKTSSIIIGIQLQVRATLLRFLLCSLIFISPSVVSISGNAYAQTQKKKDLEEKKNKIQMEIDYQNSLLNDVKQNKNRSMVQLAILNSKLSKQKELINTINSELNLLEGNISETQSEIRKKESELQVFKNEYAKIILASYKNKDSYSRLMFLFSSTTFNQAMQRIKYMQYYSEARKKQVVLIEDAQRQLQTKKQELENRKDQQKVVLVEKEAETGNLSNQKKSKEVLLTDLKKKERSIRDDINKKKAQAQNLKRAIEKVIEEEIAKARKASKAANNDVSAKITLTPEEKELSDDFSNNKGRLPWPLVEGVITESFGKHNHPDLPGIEINNNGLDIGTNKGATVRAVFNGVVVAVASVGGMEGKVIIVKHGEYLSVYSNLEDTYVKTGDKIKTKQSIGKVLTSDTEGTELHLEIWKGQVMLNPESWIAKGR